MFAAENTSRFGQLYENGDLRVQKRGQGPHAVLAPFPRSEGGRRATLRVWDEQEGRGCRGLPTPQSCYLVQGVDVHLPLLLLLGPHEHGRAHQEHVGEGVSVDVHGGQHAAEVGADLGHTAQGDRGEEPGPGQLRAACLCSPHPEASAGSEGAGRSCRDGSPLRPGYGLLSGPRLRVGLWVPEWGGGYGLQSSRERASFGVLPTLVLRPQSEKTRDTAAVPF